MKLFVAARPGHGPRGKYTTEASPSHPGRAAHGRLPLFLKTVPGTRTMSNAFDPYREALVVETVDRLARRIRRLGTGTRQQIAERLHAEPQAASDLDYVRLHTGFCRQITVSRPTSIGSSKPLPWRFCHGSGQRGTRHSKCQCGPPCRPRPGVMHRRFACPTGGLFDGTRSVSQSATLVEVVLAERGYTIEIGTGNLSGADRLSISAAARIWP